jgi:hypothetical protein
VAAQTPARLMKRSRRLKAFIRQRSRSWVGVRRSRGARC